MINFDQSKKNDITYEGEAVRLYNEILPKPASFFISGAGKRIDVKAKKGIDLRTCTFIECVNYLEDTRIKKSESISSFCHRVLSKRFPKEYADNKSNIINRSKLEKEMIQANTPKDNDIEWLGSAGFSGTVHFSDNKNTKQHSDKHKRITIRHK